MWSILLIMNPSSVVKLDNDPLVTDMSLSVKSVVASDEVNIRSMVESVDAVPLVTVVDVISMVGGILSYVQVNGVAALFEKPAGSVKLSAATFTVYTPSVVGVNVAVYTVDEVDVKLDNDPLVLTVISLSVKSVVASDEVNIRSMVESVDAVPLVTVVDVISMVGGILSYVQVNGVVAVFPLPAASVNAPAATPTVHKP